MIPEDLKYSSEHEWLRIVESSGDGSVVRIGITHFAQDSLGDIVFVQLPAVGDSVTAGQSCGEIESTKSVSDLFAPVAGTVRTVNGALDTAPELVNSDPYDAGWMFEIELRDASQIDSLMAASEYAEYVAAQ